jgi:sarcosine oxidase/L-pipecolate oxidase
MTLPEPSILIIGAGTFGTSTAVHLSKQYRDPTRITLLDRWAPDAPVGDKHAAAVDINRIIRTDYEAPLYCDLAHEAIHFWFWSIAVQGHFHKTGWVVLEGEDGGFGAGVKRTFEERASKHAVNVDASEVVKKNGVLRGLNSEHFSNCYQNLEAGWCDAASATKAYLRTAESRGVRRVTGEVVELLLDDRKGALRGVRTKDGQTLIADRVVLAAGAWTSSLLSPVEDALRIDEKDRIERQLTAVGRLSAYYTLDTQETKDMIESNVPVVVIGGEVDIIPPYYDNRTLKINDLRTEFVNSVTTPSGKRITAPPKCNQLDVPRQLRQQSEKVIQKVMPQWTEGRRPAGWRICFDSVTPTEDWLMCRHPDERLSNLYIAAGGSFHSYKWVEDWTLNRRRT